MDQERLIKVTMVEMLLVELLVLLFKPMEAAVAVLVQLVKKLILLLDLVVILDLVVLV